MRNNREIKGKIFSFLIITVFIIIFYSLIVQNNLIKEVYNAAIIDLLGVMLVGILSYSIVNNLLNKFFQSKFIESKVQDILTLNNKNKTDKEVKRLGKIWKYIVMKIESTHHTSLQEKIKDLDSYDEIAFPVLRKLNKRNEDNKKNIYIHKYDFNSLFLNKIREFAIFFEMLYEKYEHKGMYMEYTYTESDKFSIHKNFIKENMINLYKIKYFFRFLLEIKIFLMILLPLVAVSILYSFYEETGKYYEVIFGISCLALIYPLIRLVDTLTQVTLLYIFKIHTSHIILLHGIYLIILAFSFTLMAFYGIDSFFKFSTMNQLDIYGKIFEIFKNIIFSLDFSKIEISMLFNLHNENNSDEVYEFLIVIKLIMWASRLTPPIHI